MLLTILTILRRIAESFNTNLIAEDRYRMILSGLQVTDLIEEPTTRGFRIKLII